MMPNLALVLTGVVLTFAATGVTVPGVLQTMRVDMSSPAVDTVAVCPASAGSPVRTDSLIAVGRMHRVDGRESSKLPTDFAALAMGAIADRLTLPQPFQLAAYGGTGSESFANVQSSKPLTAHLSFGLEVMIAWKRDGSLKKVGLAQSSLSPALDKAIIHAILAADSARAFPTRNAEVAGQELSIYIDVDLVSRTPAGSHELFRLTLPVFLLDNFASQVPNSAAPKYPLDLRNRGVEGEASFEFVVDERGRAVGESIRVIKFSDREFARSALEMLPRAQFAPARIRGCPVKQIVQQSFQFKLDHGAALPFSRR